MLHPSLHSKIPYFVALGETLNFGRAAKKLSIAQPALSRSIRQLEEHVGYRLFERSTRRVTLTAAGEVLYEGARDAMEKLTQAVTHAAKVAEGSAGTIMVGYSAFAATGPMSDIIIEFRKRCPQAKVGLRLLASSEQATALAEGTIDLGFLMSNTSEPPQKHLPISTQRLVALVPASHPWAAEASLPLSTLTTMPLVIGAASRWQGFRRLVDDLMTAHGLEVEVAEEADDVPVLLQLVRSGFGWTILDASFVPTLPPGIRPVEIQHTAATLDIALAWQAENLSPLTARFLDVAREFVSRPESDAVSE
jgi:DNA-binding transcriptional LysR family regulator